MSLVDSLGRPLRNLRLSVTDRCNLRCQYCMPEQHYVWLPRADVLSFEEIDRLVDVFVGLGVDKVRLTGGEPLLRRDLPSLVRMLAAKRAIREIALTTNGILLADLASRLRDAGLSRVTVSLDTLQPDRFLSLTRQDALAAVLNGVRAARDTFTGLKLDSVIVRGTNEDEVLPLLAFAKACDAEIRFIEYMDVGGATTWAPEKVVTRQEVLDTIAASHGPIEELREESSAPAQRFRLGDGTVFGVIASTTSPFCRSCDRSRVTADGMWFTCLYATAGVDLRGPLRAGATNEELRDLLVGRWQHRDDRGAECRLEERNRSTFVARDALVKNPHLEMHTRGG